MMPAWEILVGVGALVGLALLGMLKGAQGSAANRVVQYHRSDLSPIQALVQSEAEARGMDPKLAEAIVKVESNWDPKAVSPENSYGLMQVLCQPDGAGGCKNRFDIVGWPPASALALLDPAVNVPLGMQILAYDVHRFGTWHGVAAYNDWGARWDPPGGPYRNQAYVDKVRAAYDRLRA